MEVVITVLRNHNLSGQEEERTVRKDPMLKLIQECLNSKNGLCQLIGESPLSFFSFLYGKVISFSECTCLVYMQFTFSLVMFYYYSLQNLLSCTFEVLESYSNFKNLNFKVAFSFLLHVKFCSCLVICFKLRLILSLGLNTQIKRVFCKTLYLLINDLI